MPTEQKHVAIYSTPTCHFCGLAKEYFKENSIAYDEFDVSTDIAKRTEMIEKSGGMAVPVITVGDDVVVGFDKERLASLIGLPA